MMLSVVIVWLVSLGGRSVAPRYTTTKDGHDHRVRLLAAFAIAR